MTSLYASNSNVASRYGVHRSTLYRWLRDDPTFPRPVMLSGGCVRWRIAELEAWEKAKAKTTARASPSG